MIDNREHKQILNDIWLGHQFIIHYLCYFIIIIILKVSLILLDQSSAKCHLKDEFWPDPASTSFKRPSNAEMNIASGCPLFVAHTLLDNPNNSYVKDDTIFIKIIIDASNL